ncbi:MAG: hypothetical protein IJB19_03940 [Clostridia bacterium]|nr:hypothetical protein [Clostridia bacterium]
MKRLKKTCGCVLPFALFFILATILVSGIRYAIRDVYLTQSEIHDLVQENYRFLLEDVKNAAFDNTEKIKGITELHIHEGIIVFSCGGKGNAASGFYTGFYYTADDLPKVSFMRYLCYDEEDLTPEGNGYACSRVDYYYTEKIQDHFYYYESHY